jgi:uncharacterized membrane protein YccC
MTGEKPELVGVSAHPRAAYGIRRAKARGGLAAFWLAVAVQHLHGASFGDVVWRALLAGLAGYLVCWAAAVVFWRQVLQARARAALHRRHARLRPPLES